MHLGAYLYGRRGKYLLSAHGLIGLGENRRNGVTRAYQRLKRFNRIIGCAHKNYFHQENLGLFFNSVYIKYSVKVVYFVAYSPCLKTLGCKLKGLSVSVLRVNFHFHRSYNVLISAGN